MSVKVYSTGCPKCRILLQKLQNKQIEFNEIQDIELMKAMGLKSAPWLEINGELMDFGAAIKWVNGLEVK
jgi:hypothetical protein